MAGNSKLGLGAGMKRPAATHAALGASKKRPAASRAALGDALGPKGGATQTMKRAFEAGLKRALTNGTPEEKAAAQATQKKLDQLQHMKGNQGQKLRLREMILAYNEQGFTHRMFQTEHTLERKSTDKNEYEWRSWHRFKKFWGKKTAVRKRREGLVETKKDEDDPKVFLYRVKKQTHTDEQKQSLKGSLKGASKMDSANFKRAFVSMESEAKAGRKVLGTGPGTKIKQEGKKNNKSLQWGGFEPGSFDSEGDSPDEDDELEEEEEDEEMEAGDDQEEPEEGDAEEEEEEEEEDEEEQTPASKKPKAAGPEELVTFDDAKAFAKREETSLASVIRRGKEVAVSYAKKGSFGPKAQQEILAKCEHLGGFLKNLESVRLFQKFGKGFSKYGKLNKDSLKIALIDAVAAKEQFEKTYLKSKRL